MKGMIINNDNTEEKFICFLTSHESLGYNTKNLRVKTIWTRRQPFQAVAVYDGEAVIQLFLLMPRNHGKCRHRYYPAYKSFRKNPSRYENVYPATYVVKFYPNEKDYKFFNASNIEIEIDKDKILGYKAACVRFKQRINANPTVKLLKRIKWVSWTMAAILSICLVVYTCFTIADGSFQLDKGIIGLCGIIVILVLLPIILPIASKVSFSGFSIGLNDLEE